MTQLTVWIKNWLL